MSKTHCKGVKLQSLNEWPNNHLLMTLNGCTLRSSESSTLCSSFPLASAFNIHNTEVTAVHCLTA